MFALPHGESCAEEKSKISSQCSESQRAAMPYRLQVRRLGFAVGLGRFPKVNRLRGQKEGNRRSTHSSLCLPLSSLQRGLISSVTRCKSSRKYQHLLTLPRLHATVFGQLNSSAQALLQHPKNQHGRTSLSNWHCQCMSNAHLRHRALLTFS